MCNKEGAELTEMGGSESDASAEFDDYLMKEAEKENIQAGDDLSNSVQSQDIDESSEAAVTSSHDLKEPEKQEKANLKITKKSLEDFRGNVTASKLKYESPRRMKGNVKPTGSKTTQPLATQETSKRKLFTESENNLSSTPTKKKKLEVKQTQMQQVNGDAVSTKKIDRRRFDTMWRQFITLQVCFLIRWISCQYYYYNQVLTG